jgi:hypothetical protein
VVAANSINYATGVDGLKALQDETSAEIDALKPSILDKAFRGELYSDETHRIKCGLKQRVSPRKFGKERGSRATEPIWSTRLLRWALLCLRSTRQLNLGCVDDFVAVRAHEVNNFQSTSTRGAQQVQNQLLGNDGIIRISISD